MKRFFTDPSFWLLVIINLWCVYYYERHPEGFTTIIWLYWFQSVFIGIFNFIDLLTIRKPDPTSMSINDQPINGSWQSRGCLAFFFLFHYQLFHFVYMIFLVVQFKGPVDVYFLLISVAAFLLGSTLQFIRYKRSPASIEPNVGKLFITPYLRIVPMHLAILAPAFLGLSASVIFLVLKAGADVLMYIITTPYNKSST